MFARRGIMNWRLTLLALCLGVVRADYSPAQTRSDQNAAALYRRACALITVDCPASSSLICPEYPPYSAEWRKMANAAFEANQQSFDLVHQASAIDGADWSDRRNVVNCNGLRNLANQVADAASFLDYQGEGNAAVVKINDMLHLADLLDRGPNCASIQILLANDVREIAMSRLMVISSNI